MEQIRDTKYSGPLLYMDTANHDMTKLHDGAIRYFSGGYRAAEKEAQQREVQFLETGGSVATKVISLLEYIGFRKNICLDRT